MNRHDIPNDLVMMILKNVYSSTKVVSKNGITRVSQLSNDEIKFLKDTYYDENASDMTCYVYNPENERVPVLSISNKKYFDDARNLQNLMEFFNIDFEY